MELSRFPQLINRNSPQKRRRKSIVQKIYFLFWGILIFVIFCQTSNLFLPATRFHRQVGFWSCFLFCSHRASLDSVISIGPWSSGCGYVAAMQSIPRRLMSKWWILEVNPSRCWFLCGFEISEHDLDLGFGFGLRLQAIAKFGLHRFSLVVDWDAWSLPITERRWNVLFF